MNKSIIWIVYAILIVALIALFSKMLANGFVNEVVMPENLETNVLADIEKTVSAEGETPEQVRLSVETASQTRALSFSTAAEVYRFNLRADASYSVRYLSFNVDYLGLRDELLSDASNWKVYEVNRMDVDFSRLVGTGESLADDVLRVRMDPYFGREGRTSLALVTSVLRDSESDESPWMRIFMPAQDWTWTPGIFEGSWISIEETFSAENVQGLPTEVLAKGGDI